MSLTGGARNGVTQLLSLLDKVPAVVGVAGPTPSSPTTATITTGTAICCGNAGSDRSSPNESRNTAAA
ncbi:hypothetical protein SGLAM104S_08303 [Streptomyces glaucescens]